MIRASVLVVDDEAPNRGLVRRVLEALGYQVREAADGEFALEEVAREVPDLILLDLEMPRRDGYGVLRVLKADPKTRLVPIVMLTSHEQLVERVKAVDLGVDDYLVKPFNVTELAARVKSLVALKRFTDELENASRVLEGIGLCVEERDRYTGNHCKRLAEYAVRVGKDLGVPEEDQKVLRLGGYLHDLGKVAISDTILNKPGRLTPEEFDLMKTHSAVGAGLVKGMRTIERVIPLIRNHHEKLDGSGYPDKLGGKDIPLLVRITSAVDVFDALKTKRAYKDSLPLEKCLAILREEAGRGWWDKAVVESLARVVGQGLVEEA
ncbi:MAG TPA: HD domain-containing phosphohydrolase [Planctomycetota bacterium]|nr:HD domain-containing phosphohydrolase [Planctomycetota bacterium]